MSRNQQRQKNTSCAWVSSLAAKYKQWRNTYLKIITRYNVTPCIIHAQLIRLTTTCYLFGWKWWKRNPRSFILYTVNVWSQIHYIHSNLLITVSYLTDLFLLIFRTNSSGIFNQEKGLKYESIILLLNVQ